MKNGLWTAGCGLHDEYAEQVSLWPSGHDVLSATKSNYNPKNRHAPLRKSQSFGLARSLVPSIPQSDHSSVRGAEKEVQALYKGDELSITSDVYKDFNALLNKLRNTNEIIKSFEMRFPEQVCSQKSNSDDIVTHEPPLALMLLFHSNIGVRQRVPNPAATTKDIVIDTDARTSVETKSSALVKNMTYEIFASLLRNCDSTDLPLNANGICIISGGSKYCSGKRVGTSLAVAYRKERNSTQPLAGQRLMFVCRNVGKLDFGKVIILLRVLCV